MEESRRMDCCLEGCLELETLGAGDLPLVATEGMTAGRGLGEGKFGEGRPELRGEYSGRVSGIGSCWVWMGVAGRCRRWKGREG